MLAGLDYNQRVDAGRKVEKQILDSLRSKGYKIEDPSSNDDIINKIDGWWIGKENKKYPVQVKFRQSGDDVLFEIIKDINKNKMGRDYKSKAVLYLVANRSGTTRLYHSSIFKDESEKILNLVKSDLQKDPNKIEWSGNGWEAKIQIDRSSGDKKLVAYFNPNYYKAIATWNLNLYEIIIKEAIKAEVKKILKEFLG